MREKPDNLYEAIAARGEGAAGAHPETPSSFVRDNPHEKTVCKRFATVFVSFDALQHLRIFEPKPRFNFATLVLSLLLAAGALSNLRKSLRDKRTETKKPLSSYLEAVSLSFLRLRRFRSFEPKPRFELGTPSLRVKCSTAELFI